MKRLLGRNACVLGISLSLLMVMVGCGGGGTTTTTPTTPAAVTIAMGSWPSSLIVGQTFQCTATVANASNTAVTWAVGGVTGGNSTLGTISSSGLYTAPALVPSPASVSISATSQADTTKSAAFSLTIKIALAVTSGGTPVTSTTLQVTGTQQFTATIQGTSNTAVTWAVNGVVGGNATVGTISTSGLYTAPQYPPSPNTVTVSATSVAFSSATSSFTITLLPPALSVSINPTALSVQINGTVQFTSTVTTTSGLPISTAVTWGVKSPGNPGITYYGYISADGLYTAPPNPPAGSLNPVPIYVASQEDPSKYAVAYATITLVPPEITISTTTLANGVAQSSYSAAISASGGAQPYVWSITAGALPAGLTLNSSTGVISGTPTTAGTSSFTVTATDQGTPTPKTKSAPLSITILPQLSITTAALANGGEGASYSCTLIATGGVTPYTWSITSGSLPAGLALNAATGAITGTPAANSNGSYPLTIKVTDSGTPQQTQSKSLSITVVVLRISTASVPYGVVNTPYSTTLVATGGVLPLSWAVTAGTLPAGLTLSTAGVLAGTPTAAVSTSYTVRVTDSSTPTPLQVSVLLSQVVYNPLAITTTTLPAATPNTAYTTTLVASGGTGTYVWSLPSGSQGFPAGLTMSAAGVVSGTPTATGTFSVGVTVTDTATPPQTRTQTVSITIGVALPTGCTRGNESVLDGKYVFNLSGIAGNGFMAIVGGLEFNGTGGITGGEADSNGANYLTHSVIDSSASYYSVGPDDRGCALIATSFGNFTTRFALGSIGSNTGIATKGRIIEFDNTAGTSYLASGQLLQIDTTGVDLGNPLSGNYVWLGQGVDRYGLRMASAGVINASNHILSNGVEDRIGVGSAGHFENQGGVYDSHSSTPDYGRFLLNRYGGGGATTSLICYQVNANKSLCITYDQSYSNPTLAGELDYQQPEGSPSVYNNSRLCGNAVFYERGLTEAWIGVMYADCRDVQGTVTANSFGWVGLTGHFGPTYPWGASNSCSYSVAANGRVDLTSDASCGIPAPIIYLTNYNEGVMLTSGPDVKSGRIEQQIPGGTFMSGDPVTGSFFLGSDTTFPVTGDIPSSVGRITWDGNGNITTGTSWIGADIVQDPLGWTGWNGGNTGINSDGSFTLSLPAYCPSCTTYGVFINANTRFVMFEPLGEYGPFSPAIVIGEK